MSINKRRLPNELYYSATLFSSFPFLSHTVLFLYQFRYCSADSTTNFSVFKVSFLLHSIELSVLMPSVFMENLQHSLHCVVRLAILPTCMIWKSSDWCRNEPVLKLQRSTTYKEWLDCCPHVLPLFLAYFYWNWHWRLLFSKKDVQIYWFWLDFFALSTQFHTKLSWTDRFARFRKLRPFSNNHRFEGVNLWWSDLPHF